MGYQTSHEGLHLISNDTQWEYRIKKVNFRILLKFGRYLLGYLNIFVNFFASDD